MQVLAKGAYPHLTKLVHNDSLPAGMKNIGSAATGASTTRSAVLSRSWHHACKGWRRCWGFPFVPEQVFGHIWPI